MLRNTTSRESSRRTPALLAGLTSSLVAAMLAGAACAAPTASSDLATARMLAAKPASGWSSVILKTADALTPVQEARVKALGGDITRRLPLIGSVAVRVPSRSLARVAALPFVTHLSPDGMTRKFDEFTVASSGAGPAFQQYGLTGQGVTVAVVDSGIRSNADIRMAGSGKQQLVASVSFIPNDTSTDDACGHGTHVAGIIAGNGAASTGSGYTHTFYGIARSANLVSVRVLDANGQASVSTVIAGLQWVVAHQNDNKSAPIRVLNLSLGHPVGESYTTDPLCQAVEKVWKAGIVVVCAAGNEGRFSTVNTSGASNEGWGTGYGSIQSPGNDPCVLTVGATKSTDGLRADDRIATYSSRGPSRLDLVLKPDIIAPGNRVISTYSYDSTLFRYNAANNNGLPAQFYMKTTWNGYSTDYFRLSGTSMAAPVVAGAAALLLQANPALTPDTVKARLMLSADKWAAPNGTGDALTYGAGYLDIPAALASTATAALPALSPALTANADGTLSLVMDRAAWGSTALTGSRAAWGSGLWGTGITDLRAAWGSSFIAGSAVADRAAWGSNSVGSSRAAWGSSVWSDRAAWGSSTSAVDLTSIAISGE